jgi:hypothetical protein
LEHTIGALTHDRTVLADEFEAAPPEGQKLLAELKGAVDKTAQAAEKVDKLYKGAKAFVGMAKAIGHVWDFIDELPPPTLC